MTLRPCIDCGIPTDGTRCTDCRPADQRPTSTERGYDEAWRRLSTLARRLQPWCTDCGAQDDLTTDHSTAAWHRKNRGRAIRLADVEVVCRSCNSKRGKAKPDDDGDTATPGRPPSAPSRPSGKAESASHTGGPR